MDKAKAIIEMLEDRYKRTETILQRERQYPTAYGKTQTHYLQELHGEVYLIGDLIDKAKRIYNDGLGCDL